MLIFYSIAEKFWNRLNYMFGRGEARYMLITNVDVGVYLNIWKRKSWFFISIFLVIVILSIWIIVFLSYKIFIL